MAATNLIAFGIAARSVISSLANGGRFVLGRA